MPNLTPRGLWLVIFAQAVSLTVGCVCLITLAHAQATTPMIAPTPQAAEGLSWREVISIVGILGSAIVGLWSRHQDTLIKHALEIAISARDKGVDLQRQIDRDHMPKIDQARMLDAALKPVQDSINGLQHQFSTLNRTVLLLANGRHHSSEVDDQRGY